MMNGREESDPAIVAKKPTNKAEQSATELVERSAEAEGNAGRQSTRRAQNRESVSQALNRVRKLATRRKKERFIALPASHQCRFAPTGVLRTQARRAARV